MKKQIATALITLLAASGCAANNSNPLPQPHGDPPANEQGSVVYELGQTFEAYTPTGGYITVEIPAIAPDEIDSLRMEAGDSVSYVKITTDNREGAEVVDLYNVKLFDEDGKEYKFTSMNGALIDWGADQELINKWRGAEIIDPHAVTESYMVGPWELPDKITGASIQVDMSTSVPLQPVS